MKVVVTRAVEEAAALEALLRGLGFEPARFPCLAFEEGPDVERIREELPKADLVVISSLHAARVIGNLIGRTSPRFAAVGAATAALLPGETVVPREGAGAEALLATLGDSVRGKRVLVPRAERGTPALIEGLQRAGARLEVLTLYRTVVPETAPLDALRGAAAISFASASAVRGFVQLAGAHAANPVRVAAIGASTAAEASAAGIRVDAVGDNTLAGLSDAVALAVRRSKG